MLVKTILTGLTPSSNRIKLAKVILPRFVATAHCCLRLKFWVIGTTSFCWPQKALNQEFNSLCIFCFTVLCLEYCCTNENDATICVFAFLFPCDVLWNYMSLVILLFSIYSKSLKV